MDNEESEVLILPPDNQEIEYTPDIEDSDVLASSPLRTDSDKNNPEQHYPCGTGKTSRESSGTIGADAERSKPRLNNEKEISRSRKALDKLPSLNGRKKSDIRSDKKRKKYEEMHDVNMGVSNSSDKSSVVQKKVGKKKSTMMPIRYASSMDIIGFCPAECFVRSLEDENEFTDSASGILEEDVMIPIFNNTADSIIDYVSANALELIVNPEVNSQKARGMGKLTRSHPSDTVKSPQTTNSQLDDVRQICIGKEICASKAKTTDSDSSALQPIMPASGKTGQRGALASSNVATPSESTPFIVGSYAFNEVWDCEHCEHTFMTGDSCRKHESLCSKRPCISTDCLVEEGHTGGNRGASAETAERHSPVVKPDELSNMPVVPQHRWTYENTRNECDYCGKGHVSKSLCKKHQKLCKHNPYDELGEADDEDMISSTGGDNEYCNLHHSSKSLNSFLSGFGEADNEASCSCREDEERPAAHQPQSPVQTHSAINIDNPPSISQINEIGQISSKDDGACAIM